MKTFSTYAELEKEYRAFDFSKIELAQPSCLQPVFWDASTEAFVAYPDDTDPEMAEQQNDVIFVGRMRKGGRPKLEEYEDRIKMKFTKEIY